MENQSLPSMVIAGGERITDGPFNGFNLVAQTDFGVKSDTVNVYTADDRFVGYVHCDAVEDFKIGDGTVLQPVENWRNTFSVALMAKLGLSLEALSNQGKSMESFMADSDVVDGYLRRKIDSMGALELFDLCENGLNMGFDIDAQDDGETVLVTAWPGREEGFEDIRDYLGPLASPVQKPSGPKL